MEDALTGSDDSSSRRRVLQWLVRSFLSLWGLASAGIVFSFLKSPSVDSAADRIVSAGSFSALGIGEARLIQHGNRPLYVLRVSEAQVIALSAVCTHRQCVLDWSRDRKSFVCPCHAGVFDASGQVTSGLPRRRLEQYRVSVRGDELSIYLGGA
jgi:cytochrome b6-f complex iron-sulfur subunit